MKHTKNRPHGGTSCVHNYTQNLHEYGVKSYTNASHFHELKKNCFSLLICQWREFEMYMISRGTDWAYSVLGLSICMNLCFEYYRNCNSVFCWYIFSKPFLSHVCDITCTQFCQLWLQMYMCHQERDFPPKQLTIVLRAIALKKEQWNFNLILVKHVESRKQGQI